MLVYSSLGMIYFGINLDSYWYVCSFAVSTGTTLTSWVTDYSGDYSDVSTVIFGKDETELFVGGVIKKSDIGST